MISISTTSFVYILSAVLLAFVLYIIRTTRTKSTPPARQEGTSEYKYTGPKPQRLVANDRSPRHVQYVPANHLNRKQRRTISSLARRNKLTKHDEHGRVVATS